MGPKGFINRPIAREAFFGVVNIPIPKTRGIYIIMAQGLYMGQPPMKYFKWKGPNAPFNNPQKRIGTPLILLHLLSLKLLKVIKIDF